MRGDTASKSSDKTELAPEDNDAIAISHSRDNLWIVIKFELFTGQHALEVLVDRSKRLRVFSVLLRIKAEIAFAKFRYVVLKLANSLKLSFVWTSGGLL